MLYIQNIAVPTPNCSFKYYVADTLSNITTKSARIIIDYTTVTNEASNTQNDNDFKARNVDIHETTKRNISIDETYATIRDDPQWLQGAYSFDVTVSFNQVLWLF